MTISRTYEKVSVEEFGTHLLESGDLDPIYIALNRTNWHIDKRMRWCVAYWCLYHAGAASYLSQFDGAEFWEWMRIAAENVAQAPNGERWPRGSERRHWRGEQAIKSIEDLTNKHTEPMDMVSTIAMAGSQFADVARRVQGYRGFGPWISFKVCDMLERCLGHHVNFDHAAVFMFKDPVEGALMVWRDKMEVPENVRPKDKDGAITEVVEYLTNYFSDWLAPPSNNRPIGLQEVETILCKWKSHMRGHYPFFNDIMEIRNGLATWAPTCESAQQFLDAMPEKT